MFAALPRETVINILRQLPFGRKDYDVGRKKWINLPARRDILQLYNTSKKFKWLSELWITDIEASEHETWHHTFNIFGILQGPQYMFVEGMFPEVNDFCGYKYVVSNSKGCILTNNHIYVVLCSIYGTVIVANGDVYKHITFDTLRLLKRVYRQWRHADPVSYHWAKENIHRRTGNLLVREPLQNYHIYKFPIELLVLSGEHKRLVWKPNVL